MAGRVKQARKECSFLKKRTKKLLNFWNVLLKQRATAGKSFLLLFFKKEALAFGPAAPVVGF
jgi:hypothetical protein